MHITPFLAHRFLNNSVNITTQGHVLWWHRHWPGYWSYWSSFSYYWYRYRYSPYLHHSPPFFKISFLLHWVWFYTEEVPSISHSMRKSFSWVFFKCIFQWEIATKRLHFHPHHKPHALYIWERCLWQRRMKGKKVPSAGDSDPKRCLEWSNRRSHLFQECSRPTNIIDLGWKAKEYWRKAGGVGVGGEKEREGGKSYGYSKGFWKARGRMICVTVQRGRFLKLRDCHGK